MKTSLRFSLVRLLPFFDCKKSSAFITWWHKTAVLAATGLFIISTATAQTGCVSVAGGLDFSGRNMTDSNFTTYSANALVGANFSNAILNGAQFQNVNLTMANFSGAVMHASAKGIADLSGTTLDHACFQQADMDSANLQFAVFRATDFSNASLLYADFGPVMTIQFSTDSIRTKFVNTTVDFNHFPISNWPVAYWSYTDLSNSKISGLTSKNFSFKGKNISWAILKEWNFSGFDFRHGTFTGVDFTGSTFNYALMDSSQMDQVKLVTAKMINTQLTGVKFYNPVNTGKAADLSGVVMNNSTLHKSDFSYANMRGASLLGVTADSCIFNNVNFQSDNTYNVAYLTGSTLSYSFFNSAQLNNVNLSNAYIVNGQFNQLTLLGTNFVSATMPGSNFQGSVLEGVLFTGAILQGANFTSSTIQAQPGGGSGVDFSCSQLGGANFSNASILQASFANAVMPVADSCCHDSDGYFCGIIAINQLAYNQITLPVLSNKVTCPNGEYAICSGSQWVVPDWQSAYCNTSHITQTLWFKPNCNGQDTAGQITFKDPALQACILSQMSGGNNNYVITKNAAAQVVSIDCPCKGISKLDGLQYFTALQELNLTGNQLTDGTFFTRLPTLKTLKTGSNQLTQLNLQGLSSLNILDASNNNLNTVMLDADSYFNYIDLSYNALTTLDVSLQTNLNYLDMSHNQLTSVGNLSLAVNLVSIFLQNNSLTTIGSVSSMYNNGQGNLLYMNLSCNLPFQCNTLQLDSGSTEINFLNSSQCGINDLPGCGTSQNKETKSTQPKDLYHEKRKKNKK